MTAKKTQHDGREVISAEPAEEPRVEIRKLPKRPRKTTPAPAAGASSPDPVETTAPEPIPVADAAPAPELPVPSNPNRRGRRSQPAAVKEAAQKARGSDTKDPQLTVRVQGRTRDLIKHVTRFNGLNITYTCLTIMGTFSQDEARQIVQAHRAQAKDKLLASAPALAALPSLPSTPRHSGAGTSAAIGFACSYDTQEYLDQLVAAAGAQGRGELFDALTPAYVESLGLTVEQVLPPGIA